MARAASIDSFKGLWHGLENYTVGLNLLSDVAQHGQSLRNMLGPLKDKEITVDLVQLLHSIQIGQSGKSPFRDTDIQLKIEHNDEIAGMLDTAAPEDIAPLVSKLIGWLNEKMADQDNIHPLVTIALFSSVFLQISPFPSHNIRTVRFLIMLLMLKAGYTYAPYVPLDTMMQAQGRDIHKTLLMNQASLEAGSPEWQPWIICFLDILCAHKNTLEDRLRGAKENLSDLPTLSLKIMGLFDEHERLQMKDIQRLTGGRRSTIKLRLGELVESGYLRRHGQARSTWYSQV